jgi:pyruvate,orthophosphate dikinase
MIMAQGVLTSRGGMTSHAAVVARGMGKPCVAGCESLHVDLERRQLRAGDRLFREGDTVTLNGSTGEVIAGSVPTLAPELTDEFRQLMSWADAIRKLGVRTNADTPEDAARARDFGAQGIGLCRTEHMFMQPERLPVIQKMIMSETERERREHLDRLLPFQREDFLGIFRAMEGLPVTVRLLDPPLHEFLPNLVELSCEVAVLKATGSDARLLREKEILLRKVHSLHESNPMMGLRGCRLGLTYPEINEMQVRAIMEAACQLTKEGLTVYPEIMIPLIGHVHELVAVKTQLEGVAREVMESAGVTVAYRFGTMIEIPRAALTAARIAEHAEFFSFGTNDLTQMTFGYSRDDAEGRFMSTYLEAKILESNPFETLDQEGVGQLMELAVNQGRSVRPDLKLGICGEHGGDPASVGFAHRIGLDYVSCSPFRVPIARLAAAQATVGETVVRDK